MMDSIALPGSNAATKITPLNPHSKYVVITNVQKQTSLAIANYPAPPLGTPLVRFRGNPFTLNYEGKITSETRVSQSKMTRLRA